MGKFFVPLLKPFTSNNYTVKESFDFAKDIIDSLDVYSLFTNMLLDATIEYVLTNCLNLVFGKVFFSIYDSKTPKPLKTVNMKTSENFLFFGSNRLLLTIIQLRTLDFTKDITQQSSKLFSQTCHLTKLLKYVLTNYLNKIKRFQTLRNNKSERCFC